MSVRKDGGPAYPLSAHPEHGYGAAESVHEGMSLRDRFAMQALPSLLTDNKATRGDVCKALHITSSQFEDDPEVCVLRFTAQHAYKIADAMIAAREA